MKSTNPESQRFRVGKAEVGLVIDNGCLRSIGEVMVSGTALRNPLARFLPWFDSYEGEVFDRFEFLGIEQSGQETRIRFRAVSNVDYPFRERRDSSGDLCFRNRSFDGRAVDLLTGANAPGNCLNAWRVCQLQ